MINKKGCKKQSLFYAFKKVGANLGSLRKVGANLLI